MPEREPFTRETLDELRRRLERARRGVLDRTLRDEEVWALMAEADAHRRAAVGTPYEGAVSVIADLVRSTWNVTRARSSAVRRLEAARGE